MAFLNRQGIGFLFFGALIYVLLSTTYFSTFKRMLVLFLLGGGMVLSHYSTSYVAIALFMAAYFINRILRLLFNAQRPKFLAHLKSSLANKEIYKEPILIPFIFVLGLFLMIYVWGTVITQTSSNLSQTVSQIVLSIEHPFSFDDYSGAAKYSLTQSKVKTPQELLTEFIQSSIAQLQDPDVQAKVFPLSVAESYPLTLAQEPTVPLSWLGTEIQSIAHINLGSTYDAIKQLYAKLLQVLLLIGLIGLGIGYTFKKQVSEFVSTEYLSLSIAGIGIMVAQTILPASAINYGLLRLFQQNLIFLGLPIVLGLLFLLGLLIRNRHVRLLTGGVVLVIFFVLLSGLIPQLTGGTRAPLPLDNYGFYYDAYYTHAEEVYAIDWLRATANLTFPVQSDHYFSGVKLITYGEIAPVAGLLPATIQRNSYVFLNYYNARTGNIIEFVNGDVFYYHFPLDFLDQHKDLIYNNGGTLIYF